MQYRSIMKYLPLAIMACLWGGCVTHPQRPDLAVWPAGEMTQLTDQTPRFDDRTVLDDRKRVSLFSAANETVSFQVLIDVPDQGLSGLKIGCDGLSAPGGAKIAGENVKAFRMLPVKVTEFPAWYLRLSTSEAKPASYYDALVPITAPTGGQPFSSPAKSRLAFWVDVSVPRTAAAGVYTGSLRLSSDSHNDAAVPIALQVYGFMLPDLRPLSAVGGFDHMTLYRTFVFRDGKPYLPVRLDRTNPQVREGLAVMRQMMVLAHEHRLDLFESSLRPALRRETSGKINIDWEDYDNFVTPYLTGGAFDDRIGVKAWPAPLCGNWPDPADYGGLGSDSYASLVAEISDQCRRHFQSAGASDQLFYWPLRGEVSESAFNSHLALARLIKTADTQTPVLGRLPLEAPPQTLWTVPKDFASSVDIAAPPAHWLDTALATKLARKDSPLRGVWLSPGEPPYLPSLSVASSPSDIRAIPWFAMKYRCAGLFIPEVLDWNGDIFNSPAGAETRLFYPGKPAGIDGVLPSVRLKHLRRGCQDLGYLWILRQRQKGAVATSVMNSQVRYAGLDAAGDHYLDPRLEGYVREGDTWQRARRLLAEEIESAVQAEATPNSRLLAQRQAWKEFDEKVHSVRPEQVRAVARPVEGTSELLTTVEVDLFNEYARDSQVLVKLEDLPEGWKPVTGEASITMPSCTRATVKLQARGTHVPAGGNGKMPLGVSITSDMTRRQDISAAVPFMLVAAASSQPAIDGSLDDWPLRAGNTAGDFKALGRRGGVGDGTARRQTLAFILRDDKNLYVSMRCDEPDLAALNAQPTNVVKYQQLMACGEDMVEILLDPGASAKSAEDLYHVIVKSNGVIVTEKGVHSDPPLGKATAWPANAKVAVKTFPQQKIWVVEMSIPLESLGSGAGKELWGVNFMRFATQGMEASSWSGASRYFYDPRNLGTMLVKRNESSAKEQ